MLIVLTKYRDYSTEGEIDELIDTYGNYHSSQSGLLGLMQKWCG